MRGDFGGAGVGADGTADVVAGVEEGGEDLVG